MHPAQQVRFFADTEVSPGTTARTICPQCSGGSSGERTLAVTKGENGDILWYCFRASCNWAGSSVVGWYDEEHVKPLQKSRIFKGAIVRPLAYGAEFKEKYGFIPDTLGWAPEYGRFVQPIRGPMGQDRGVTLRCIDGTKQPKTLAYPAIEDQPFIHWTPHTSYNKIVILVEDWISAEKVSLVPSTAARGVCLNGTHIDYTRAMEISRVAGDTPVMVCLDKDATSKAFGYAAKYKGLIRKLLVYPLERDIKDCTPEEIRTIYDYGASFSS